MPKRVFATVNASVFLRSVTAPLEFWSETYWVVFALSMRIFWDRSGGFPPPDREVVAIRPPPVTVASCLLYREYFSAFGFFSGDLLFAILNHLRKIYLLLDL